MLDVKVLILFVLSRILFPVDVDKLFELCYQDDCLSYFDVCEAIPQMVETGHVREIAGAKAKKYEITEAGREVASVMQDTVATAVAQRAKAAADRFNRQIRRDSLMRTEVITQENGESSVRMALDDETGQLMALELNTPTLRQARKLEKAFRKNAEKIYHAVMGVLLADEN